MNHLRYLLFVLLLNLGGVATVNAAAGNNGKIVIGVVPEVNLVRQMERYVPLSDYLDKKCGYDIEIRPISNYGQLLDDLSDGRVDGGVFGSMIYVISRVRLGIIPLARPVLPNGKSTYSAVMFARKDARISKPADLKGKTIALADPSTSAGYLAQKEYLAEHGINIDKDMTIIWAGSHEAAIRAVLSNQAEVGGAKDTVLTRYRRENRIFDTLVDTIPGLHRRNFPDNTVAVRKNLEPGKREALKNALLQMHGTPDGKAALAKFGASRFIPTSDDDYKPLYSMLKHLKIDPATYQYKKPAN